MQNDANFWFSSGERLLQIGGGAVLLYAFTILLVRLLGKRATAQMNNFDWMIAVASGSLLASGILLRDISYTGAALAMTVLGLCQYLVTKFFATNEDAAHIAKAQPRLLLHKGHFLEDAMIEERITRAEINAKLRTKGIVHPAGANWVVIEPDGQLSVIPRDDTTIKDADCLEDVVYDKDVVAGLEAKEWRGCAT